MGGIQKFLLFSLLLAMPTWATQLFYNGAPSVDPPNGGNFLDCNNCRGTGLFVYDNFSLTAAHIVEEIYGTWFTDSGATIPTQAYWAIRSGIGQNNDGTLLAGGFSTLTTQSVPPLPGFPRPTFRGTVSNLSVTLGPGTYWLTISPTMTFGESFLVGTNGAGGINSLIDGNSYVRGPYWSGMQHIGNYSQPFALRSTFDFSYGVNGSTVPEPSATALATIGLGLATLLRRRRSPPTRP